ncbi:hypothetical protein HF086_016007, partial [Spodoptera exigua]
MCVAVGSSSRPQSLGCGRSVTSSAATVSIPPPPIRYRESNASRQPSAERPKEKDGVEKDILTPRSKTLSSVGHTHLPTAEAESHIMSKSRNNHRANVHSIVGHMKPTTDGGYGKPLVTPINKKLIRRDEHWFPDLINYHKVDVVTSVLGHIIFWRAARIIAYLYPIYGSNWIVIVTILAFAVLFWTAAKSSLTGNKLRASNTNPNVFPDTKTPTIRSNVASRLRTFPLTRPSASSLPRTKSPQRQYITMSKPQGILTVQTKQNYGQRDMKDPRTQDKRNTKQWKPEINSRACATPPRSANKAQSPTKILSPTRASSPAPKRIPTSEIGHRACSSAPRSPTRSPTPTRLLSSTRASSPAPKRMLPNEPIKKQTMPNNDAACEKEQIRHTLPVRGQKIKENKPSERSFNEELRKQQLNEAKKKFQ